MCLARPRLRARLRLIMTCCSLPLFSLSSAGLPSRFSPSHIALTVSRERRVLWNGTADKHGHPHHAGTEAKRILSSHGQDPRTKASFRLLRTGTSRPNLTTSLSRSPPGPRARSREARDGDSAVPSRTRRSQQSHGSSGAILPTISLGFRISPLTTRRWSDLHQWQERRWMLGPQETPVAGSIGFAPWLRYPDISHCL